MTVARWGPTADPALSTAQAIRHWMRHRPDAIAVIEGRRRVSYLGLGADVARFTLALRATGVSPGMLIGISCADRYLHLVIVLACGVIGATSISLTPAEVAGGDPILGRCHLVCADIAVPDPPEGQLPLRPDVVARIMQQPLTERELAALDRTCDRSEVMRLIKTSGTTGRPKVMETTVAMAQDVVAMELSNPDDPGFAWDYLCVYAFSFRGAQRESELTLRMGATVVFTDLPGMFQWMRRLPQFRATLMPGDVSRLMDAIPADWPGRRTGMLYVKAGALPASVRQMLAARVVTHLEHHYATNETHTLALLDEDGIATLHRDAQIRIVDADGRPVPVGTVGMIEARTPWMSRRYLWDQQANAVGFRDGWYRTNDLGRMLDATRFLLLGRADEMLVLGGVKLATQPIEARLRDLEGVRDAVLITLPDAAGRDVLHVVIESPDPRIVARVRPAILRILAEDISGTPVILRHPLPRTGTGKVLRHELRETLSRAR